METPSRAVRRDWRDSEVGLRRARKRATEVELDDDKLMSFWRDLDAEKLLPFLASSFVRERSSEGSERERAVSISDRKNVRSWRKESINENKT